MKMKRILIFIITSLFLLDGNFAQNGWQLQPSPIGSDLISVWFTDSLFGWIASDKGEILHTIDAGKHWSELTQIENINPAGLVFFDRNLGWLAGQAGNLSDTACIMRTSDGGTQWETVFRFPHAVLNDLFFINDTMGWTAGYELSGNDTLSLILHSINGGDSWIMPQGIRIENELYSIHFRDMDYGQACGQDGIFFTTNNGGRNEISGWAADIAIPSYGKDLCDIFNAGDNNGCAVGEGGFVLFTKDKWANNLDYTTGSEDTLMAVTGLPDGVHYWAAGMNGCIVRLQYAFNLLNIIEEDRITTNDLADIFAVNDHFIWAVGESGTVIFYGNQQLNANEEPQKSSCLIYPCPANNYLRIEAENGAAFKLVNSSGLVVKEGIIAGRSLVFDVSHLPGGIYLAVIDGTRDSFVYKVIIQ